MRSNWLIFLILIGCAASGELEDMKLSSPVFSHEGKIPSKYTCDGENTNPALEFSDIPKNAKSLVLIMEDPDVPEHLRADGMWNHWVVFNIPLETKGVGENQEPPGIEGITTSKKLKYGGPCPPDREHRYFFKLFALDTMLNLPQGSTKEQVLDAIKGHILAEAELMGKYQRVEQ